MAAGKIGGKRKIYFTISKGLSGKDNKNPAQEMKVGSDWKAGKSRNKFIN